MNCFSVFPGCKEAITDQQSQWINAVLQSAKPDIIFLLGASLQHRSSESIFLQNPPSPKPVADFFFLILLTDLGNKDLSGWQDKIETNCRHLGNSTAWVLTTRCFQQWLKLGSSFAIQVWNKAVRLYDNGVIKDAGIQETPPAVSTQEIEKILLDGKNRSHEFFVGAELFCARKQFAMAAFMLHQSAEQALITLVKTRTGYHANTHSIERLLRLAELVTYGVRDILPRNTEKQKTLFAHLQKAYIESRYKSGYNPAEQDLLYLLPRVKQIIEFL